MKQQLQQEQRITLNLFLLIFYFKLQARVFLQHRLTLDSNSEEITYLKGKTKQSQSSTVLGGSLRLSHDKLFDLICVFRNSSDEFFDRMKRDGFSNILE